MNQEIVSFEILKSIVEEASQLAKSLQGKIHAIGSVELPDKKANHLRVYRNVFLKDSVCFFKKRADFINKYLDLVGVEEVANLKNFYRPLIEVYCHILYFKNSRDTDEQKIKKIIWEDLYTSAMVSRGEFPPAPVKIKLDMSLNLLRMIGENIDYLEILRAVKEYLQTSNKKLLNKLEKDHAFSFPPVGQIVREFHDDATKPNLAKADVLQFYSLLSEQLHVNFYMENAISTNMKHRLRIQLIQYYLRFLKEIYELLGINEDDIAQLISKTEDAFSAARTIYNLSQKSTS